jgi:hypothetical protein
LVFEGVQRCLGRSERETLPVERHLHHAPAREVYLVVLERELVHVGGLS